MPKPFFDEVRAKNPEYMNASDQELEAMVRKQIGDQNFERQMVKYYQNAKQRANSIKQDTQKELSGIKNLPAQRKLNAQLDMISPDEIAALKAQWGNNPQAPKLVTKSQALNNAINEKMNKAIVPVNKAANFVDQKMNQMQQMGQNADTFADDIAKKVSPYLPSPNPSGDIAPSPMTGRSQLWDKVNKIIERKKQLEKGYSVDKWEQ
jgi:L-fucose mutarotase/ribose pyranase (RbsD/FucU family)